MKVPQRDRAQLLGQVPLFSHCSQRELAKVAKLANELELPAGHTLIHEDAEGWATPSVSWRSSCAGPEPPR
jgi:hypothetical protein